MVAKDNEVIIVTWNIGWRPDVISQQRWSIVTKRRSI